MKKLSLVLIASLCLGVGATAQDLLSIATNGAVKSNSLGVKVLNKKEMSKVVGGYKSFSASWYAYVNRDAIRNHRKANEHPVTSSSTIYSNAFASGPHKPNVTIRPPRPL